jgi:hypothetical protein
VGQFRGSNLFGDLPADSRRGKNDWVLRRGTAAVWVTGKKPKGKGWSLDPGARGDCKWWLRVTGKVERRKGIVYIKGKKVDMAKKPT